jgi:hypothetical protein
VSPVSLGFLESGVSECLPIFPSSVFEVANLDRPLDPLHQVYEIVSKVSMATNKTTPTRASVKDYIASRASAQQRADVRRLMALFKSITGHPPKMWGPSIVGYGSQRYTYDSGRTGEVPLACFAIRGRDLVVYVSAGSKKQKALLARLGKHSMGKSCLYFRHLADLDTSVLEQLIAGSIAEFQRHYGRGPAPAA